jgi:hypothetical protein
MRLIKLFIIFIFLFYTGQCFSQEEVLPPAGKSQFSMGSSFQMWKIGAAPSISQISFPVNLLIAMKNNFNIIIYHHPALSGYAKVHKINSLSDTWIQGNYIFWKKKAMLNLGFGIPTGRTRLRHTETTDEEIVESEFELSQWLSKSVLRFRMPIYGQGFCTKIGGAMAFTLHKLLVVGIGGQYISSGPFVPVIYTYADQIEPEEYEFDPGDELSLNVGMDVKLGKNTKLMIDGVYTYYGHDLKDGLKIFESGGQYIIDTGIFHQMDEKYLWGRFIYRHKGKHSVLDGLNFSKTDQNLKNTQLETELKYKVWGVENGGFYVVGEGRIYEGVEEEDDKIMVFGGGIETNIRMNNMMAALQMKYHGGKYNQVKVTGIEIFINLIFEL